MRIKEFTDRRIKDTRTSAAGAIRPPRTPDFEAGGRMASAAGFSVQALNTGAGYKKIIAICFMIVTLSVPAQQTPFTSEGITEPVKDETLSTLVSGMIMKIRFKEGEPIEKDDVLVELDRKVEELEIARRKLIADSKIEIKAAERRTAILKTDFDATKRLYDTTKSVSKEELDNKELEYMMAVADYERLGVVEEREKIEYEMAREQLKRRHIVSPISGVITKIFLEEGEICEVNQPLIRIVDTSQCYFISHVDAKTAPLFSLEQIVMLDINAGQTVESIKGKVSFVSPVVDPASGLRKIKVLFDNKKGTISPGVTGVMKVTE